MQAPRLLRQLAAKQIGRRSYTGHGPSTTLSDFPSPQGSWKTHFDATQRRYNLHLVGGVGALAASLLAGQALGYLEFHDDIPARPADISSYN